MPLLATRANKYLVRCVLVCSMILGTHDHLQSKYFKQPLGF